MEKKLNLSVTYKSRTSIIECRQREIPEKIEEVFNVRFDDVILYVKSGNKRHSINIEQVTDIMKLEIIPKLRSLRSENGSPQKLADTIIEKLGLNSPLNGPERKFLIDLLKGNSLRLERREQDENKPEVLNKSVQASISQRLERREQDENKPEVLNKSVQASISQSSKKRKLDEDGEIFQKPELLNKKVQCTLFMKFQKDDSTQTDGLNNALEERTTDELVDEMKRLATSCHQSLDKDVVEHLMNVTFDERRNFILLKFPPVSFIKDKYPLLFNIDEVKHELDRLFYVGKCQEFLKNMKEYSKFILNMPHKENDEIHALTQKCMKQARAPFQKAYAEVVGSVFAVSKLLKEEFRFIHLQDCPSGSEDVYPYIDASWHTLKEVFFERCEFNVVVEGLLLCKVQNFSDAILCLLSAFFIFNISYPESCKGTLTCFEKLYLCANDTVDIEDSTLQIIKYLTLQVKESKKHDISY